MKKFILILSFIPLLIVAQQNKKIDSLLNIYNRLTNGIDKVNTMENLFHHYKYSDKPKALHYANEAVTLSKQIKYTKGEGLGYTNLGYFYRLEKQPDSARHYFNKAMMTLKDSENKRSLWHATHEFSVYETIQGNFKKALELADKAENIAKELKNGSLIMENARRKATIYLDQGDYKMAITETLRASKISDTLTPYDPEKKAMVLAYLARIDILRGNYADALKPLNDVLTIYTDAGNKHWQATILMEIGNLYWYMDELDKALINYQKSLEISYEMNRVPFISMNLSNIGLIHLGNKNYDLALKNLLESERLDSTRGSTNNRIIGLNNIATAYFGKKNYAQAIQYHSKAIALADSIKSVDILRDGYNGRSKAYEKTGNYIKALEDQRLFQKINDSVFNTTKAKQIDELKTQYETEKKEQQIVLQENEIEILEKEAKISNLQKILLGGGLTLALVVISFGFYGYRQKIKRNKVEKEKLDAELAFKKKELTTHALHLAKKNEVLENLKQQVKALKTSGKETKGYQLLIKTINFDQQDDKNWENFTQYFEQVHKNFSKNVKNKYPEVTKNELRFMALLKMNMSSKEIATILNISTDGVKKARQRLRKKMDLTPQDSLEHAVLAI
ncbi:tetratricopeptide repeat protein [Flavobacteriaceae bacterium SZ-1-7]|uniref:tetratricopeptide repeat protein n=1 Tax=Tamlana sedimenti TaxID=3134126 RepID=UPI0031230D7F